jgi:flagellar biosynthesis protein FliR
VFALTWLRALPLFMLTPYLALGWLPGLLEIALSLGSAWAITPLSAAGGESVGVFWPAAVGELVRGVVAAIGCGLPLAAIRSSGAIADALGGWSLDPVQGDGKLARIVGLGALAIAVAADGLTGALGLVFDTGAGVRADLDARALLLPLAWLALRAFVLGVSLAAPLLLGALAVGSVLAILVRVGETPQLRALGVAAAPWLTIGLLSVSLAHWFSALPAIVRGFVQSALRVWAGLP